MAPYKSSLFLVEFWTPSLCVLLDLKNRTLIICKSLYNNMFSKYRADMHYHHRNHTDITYKDGVENLKLGLLLNTDDRDTDIEHNRIIIE